MRNLHLKLFAVFLFFTSHSFAHDYNNGDIQLINKGISYYIDSGKNFTVEEIKTKPFIASSKEILNFYNTAHKLFWVHFSLKNITANPSLYLNINYSLIDKLVMYEIDSSGNKIDSLTQGFNVKNSSQTPFFNLNIKPGEGKDYYLKIETKAPIFIPLEIGPLEKFTKRFERRDNLTGLYLGIMLALFFYNAFIYFFVKDKSYIYYIIYTLFMALTQITIWGYAWRFLGTGTTLNYYLIILFPSIAGISNIQFAKIFMNLKTDFPVANKIFNAFIIIYIIAITLVFTNQYFYAYRVIDTNVLFLSIYAISISVIALRRGNRAALFFFISWVVLLLALILYVLRNFEIIPYNKVPSYLLYVGSAIQTILLSIALADRINIYKKETALSQERALKISLENEKLVKEQNIVLEKEVANRTSELKQSNTQLNDALTNLKDAQTQLVEAEKMASLGQLTAGIAHEINNPINFVKSNINPLRLDVKDLVEVLNAYDELHSVNDTNAYKQKLAEIQELKEDMDISFVRKEIDSLIIGIEEGAERTAEIVRGLRTFSRIDEAALKTVNVHDGILSTLVLLKNNIPHYIKVIKEFNAEGEVECFPGKLNQVFMNILTNATQAIKAKPVKADEESITISTKDVDGQIEISIKDTGPGMTEEVKHRIFEPFFTTKDVGEGTGLGMAIVFKIIQKHAGKINIITAPNEGAEFIITLPHQYQGLD
ncbi:MAG: sensor histidine kinase [Parafilimonas sp.]|nr:sensor histidine kinase [Parafilimonas sp.]